MSNPSRPELLLLTRPECGLCEEFEAELVAAFGNEAFVLVREDVDGRDDWQRRWGLKIPVLLAADGTLVCAARFDRDAVAEALGRP